MSIKHISSFYTDDAGKLSRQLSELEDNISNELDRLTAAGMPSVALVRFNAASPIATAVPGQQISLDSSLQVGLLAFPALLPANFGQVFTVIMRSATNLVRLSCADTTVTLNGGAFGTLTMVGASRFYCDASGYYR